MIGTFAAVYSITASLVQLLQARTMLHRHASCDVSISWLSVTAGGYVIWLVYGFTLGSLPLICTDSIGLICGGFTLAVAIAEHGSCAVRSDHG